MLDAGCWMLDPESLRAAEVPFWTLSDARTIPPGGWFGQTLFKVAPHGKGALNDMTVLNIW